MDAKWKMIWENVAARWKAMRDGGTMAEETRLVPTQFRMAIVCTGNVCRSPVGSAWIEKWLNGAAPIGSFKVSSAGTAATTGSRMEKRAMEYLPSETDGSRFRSRQIDIEALATNDLILTADRSQRSYCAGLYPPSVHKLFTLREFARMAQFLLKSENHVLRYQNAESLPERWKMLLGDAPLVRPQTMAGDPSEDDILDPYGKSAMVYRRMMREMMPALEQLRNFNRL